MKKIRNLQLKHVQEQLSALKKQDMVARPPKGWIRFIREALGMSSKALAKRAGISANTMSEAERAEISDSISLKRLKHLADSMNCDVVYYLLPREPIREMIEKRARHLAEQKLRNVAVHMDIEDQAVGKEFIEERLQEEIEELKYSKKLWDER
ncbi:MAG: mobile mystery protein A [Halobacteriovoraceae bacterium]|nr:mobile mystery protein A [Halobacteriovoraceae bacterium]